MRESSESSWSVFNPLLISIKSQWSLQVGLLMLHLLASVAVTTLTVPVFTRVVLLLVIFLSAALTLKEWLTGNVAANDTVTGLLWRVDKKQLRLRLAGGKVAEIERIIFSAKVPGLIAMKLQRVDRVCPTWLLLTPEQLNKREWRRLSLVLRFRPQVQREASGQG